MKSEQIIDRIIAAKNEAGLTNQQLADLSGVPKSTVDKIVRKDTANPSLQNILDLAAAVGLDFSESEKSANSLEDPHIRHIINMYEKQLEELRRERNRERAEKNRRIDRLSLILGILCSGIVFIYLADITNPDVGWFQNHSVEISLLVTLAVIILSVVVFTVFWLNKEK